MVIYKYEGIASFRNILHIYQIIIILRMSEIAWDLEAIVHEI